MGQNNSDISVFEYILGIETLLCPKANKAGFYQNLSFLIPKMASERNCCK